MVKFILPLAFSLSALIASPGFADEGGICDHVDLEVIKEMNFSVEIEADGYESSSLTYKPKVYQGCNVAPKTTEKGSSAALFEVDDKFYFFKGKFAVEQKTADAMQAAFDRGQKVKLIFRNNSVIEMTGETAK